MIPDKLHAGERHCSCFLAGLLVAAFPGLTEAGVFEQCLLQQTLDGNESMTLAEVRAICRDTAEPEESAADLAPTNGALEERIRGEERASGNRFVITPHRPNYILPMSYNSRFNRKPYESHGDVYSNTEVKFQISLKAPVWEGVFNGYGDLYGAYTNTSWWQAYNKEFSSPFRETNHEPELFMVFPTSYQVLGLTMRGVMTGIVHQSNGRTGYLSRSWNRAYAHVFFERDNFYFSLKPWLRFHEDEKDINEEGYPNVPGDDNPDIEDYMGHGELHFGYKYGSQHFAAMVRNNFSTHKGAVQIDWSFPLTERFRGYVQYFNGYGESLIDYNASVNRLSLGVMLTDWL
ncbi:MAG: phospholipase A [Endozoicomonas sp.]